MDLYETVGGRDFIDVTMPRIAQALEDIAETLKTKPDRQNNQTGQKADGTVLGVSLEQIENTSADDLGGVIVDALMEDDNDAYSIGKYVKQVFASCRTDSELAAANAMLTAITSYNIKSLVEKADEMEE